MDWLASFLSSAVFQRIIFNPLFNYFLENNLFTECQSGFLPGDSCMSQLLSSTYEIYKYFYCNPSVDVRGNFLDISKAFGNVWHDGLIYKLKSYVVEKKPSKPNAKLFDKPSTTCSAQWVKIKIIFSLYKRLTWWFKVIMQNIWHQQRFS